MNMCEQPNQKCKYVRKGRINSNFCPCQNNPIINKKDIRQRLLKTSPLFSNSKHFTPHKAEAINPIDSSETIHN